MIKKISEDEILSSIDKLPVLSEVVSRSLTLLNDPNCSIRQLSDLIGKDQSISVRMIKMANSAFYGHPRQIKSLSESIVLLGFKRIRSLLIMASAAKLMTGAIDGYMIEKGDLWKHSYGVAFTSGLIAKISSSHDSDEAFTAGVLHDIGKLVLGNYLKGSYEEIVNLSRSQKTNFSIAEKRLLGYNHAEVGGMMLEKWNFPTVMSEAVKYHHEPHEGEESKKLVGILYLANNWVKALNIGVVGDFPNEELENLIVKDLRLIPEAKEQILAQTETEINAMDELFPVDKSTVNLSDMPD